ncbi:response regulator [Albibacterium indicum]|uniref:response regulator n=1 Tax=Albibacterium indicum TaxID=2292082 RepID=UPI0013EF30C1|nr:response regulator transcription factor [Pedobacter indicus]
MKKIRIIICDDHPLITEGIHSFIVQKSDMEVVATAKSGGELMSILSDDIADVLLLDVNLPDDNGIDLCVQVKKMYPDIKILGLSNFNERSVIVRMLNNGASGYLVKSESVQVVEQAIRHIYDGGVYFGKEAQKTLNSLTKKELLEIPPITKREKEVLQYLDAGLSSPMIAEKMFISSLTVDSHRKNLLRKFDVSKTINLVQKAKEMGII